MKTLDNGTISIAVKEHGAELSSLRLGGREYLWQADEQFWKRHSPVLFPIVGSVWEKKYRSGGRKFALGQHGFARDMDFTLLEQTEDSIWYVLESSEQTHEKYPYDFRLEIGYHIHGKSVDVMWRVKNTSESQIAFQIGAHPAFHWPLLSDGAIAAGTEAMKSELASCTQRGWFLYDRPAGPVKKAVIGQAGCVDPSLASEDMVQEGGYLPLDTETFLGDALIYEDGQVSSVTLCDQDKNPYLKLEFDAPVVGLWSPPGKNAPFVCIEPWYGRTDKVGYEGEYEDKDWMQFLSAGETFFGGYVITLF